MRQNIISLFVKFFGALVSYALTVYISLFLGNEKLGYFSFFLSYALVFTLIMKFGTDMFLMKWVSSFTARGEDGKAKYLYIQIIRYHLLTGLPITLFAVWITPYLMHNYFPSYRDIGFFRIIICSVFFLNLHIINYEFLRGKQKVVAYTFFSTVAIFLLTIVILIFQDMAGFQYDRKLEIAYLLASIATLMLSSVKIRSMIQSTEVNKIPDFSIADSLKKSFPFFSNNAVFILIGSLDIFILSKYVTPQVVGEYALILKFSGFVAFPLIVMAANFSPKIVSISDRKALQIQITRLTYWIAAGSVVVFFLIMSLIPLIKQYLHITHIAAFNIFIWVGLGYIISAACALNEASLLMLGEEKLYQKIMLAALVLNFVLNLLLIPMYKETGAAVTTCITLLSWNLAAVYVAKKKLNLTTSIIN